MGYGADAVCLSGNFIGALVAFLVALAVGFALAGPFCAQAHRYVEVQCFSRDRERVDIEVRNNPSVEAGSLGKTIPPSQDWGKFRYLKCRFAIATSYAAVLALYGMSMESIEYWAFFTVLAFLSVVDFEVHIIPNRCILAACVIRASYMAMEVAVGGMGAKDAWFFASGGIAMGILMAAFSIIAEKALRLEPMGGGDLKLLAVSGLYFGAEGGVAVVLLACIFGLVASAIARRFSAEDKVLAVSTGYLKQKIPFGPCISAACVMAAIASSDAVSASLFCV